MPTGLSWSCDQQVCASCRYWSGQREIDFLACFFNVKSDKGMCNGPMGSFRGVEMSDGASCSEWQPFRANS